MEDRKAQNRAILIVYGLMLLLATTWSAIKYFILEQSGLNSFLGEFIPFALCWSIPLILGAAILGYRKITRADEKPVPPDSADVAPFTVRVDWFMQGILYFTVGLILIGALTTLYQPSIASFLVLPVAAGAAWYIWALAKSTVEVDQFSIVVHSPHGCYRMKWDEINKITTNGTLFSFQNDHKHLSVSMAFAGAGRISFYQYVNFQIERRQIALQYPGRVPLLQKNTRVNKQ